MGSDRKLPDVRGGDSSAAEVFRVFLQLGLTSFGGPVAHLGYFRDAFVIRRRWLDEHAYGDLLALCQFLPGPASSQVGISIGLSRAGLPGAFAAWAGFTLPSALLLALFGYGVVSLDNGMPPGVLRGLKIVAVAVVLQAVIGMARTLCPDWRRRMLAAIAAIVVITIATPLAQIGAIAAGAAAGRLWLKSDSSPASGSLGIPVSKPLAVALLGTFFILLAGLPLLATAVPSTGIALADSFFRSGSLVFGGGHVVLPLLQAEVVPPGWVSDDTFLAGYGAAQAVPGPLFTFSAYLGAVMEGSPGGWAAAVICLVAIFAPSFLLVIGVLPFWNSLRQRETVRDAMLGVNAAVVGLLVAALYHPVWTSGIRSAADLALALVAFGLLAMIGTPPWLVVLLAAAGGWGLQAAGL
ncbi:MAG: chromate efflux transporter [Woeseia sp.]